VLQEKLQLSHDDTRYLPFLACVLRYHVPLPLHTSSLLPLLFLAPSRSDVTASEDANSHSIGPPSLLIKIRLSDHFCVRLAYSFALFTSSAMGIILRQQVTLDNIKWNK
jgi:hypothetical protein